MKPKASLTVLNQPLKLRLPLPSGLSFTLLNKADRRETMAAMCMLAPSLIGVSMFILLPFLDALRRSFFSAMGGRLVGLNNFRLVLENEAFRLAAQNITRFTLWCIPLLLVISLALALAVHAAADASGILKTGFLLPMAIPTASIVLLWRVLFHQNGIINKLLDAIGGTGVDWMGGGSFVVLVASYLWKNCGYDMVLWLSGLYGVPPELYEAARADGANGLQRLVYITLPSLRPHLFTITVLSLLNSFKVFREAYLLMGDYPHKSIYLLQHLFNNWFVTLDIDKLCAAASLMAVTVFLLILILQKTVGRNNA